MRSIFLYFLFTLSACIAVRAQAEDIETYIRKQHGPFYEEIQKSRLLSKDLLNSRFIFMGEIHGFAGAQAADLALLKMLNLKVSLRYYLVETDDAKAWMLNNYLADGNEVWLKQVFRSWQQDTAQWANKEYYEKFTELRHWQQKLPEHKKIRVIGIDQPQDLPIYAQYLRAINDSAQHKNMFRNDLEQLAVLLETGTPKASEKQSAELLQRLNSEEKNAQIVFHSFYNPLLLLLENLSRTDTPRDQAMFLNLQRHIGLQKLEKEKMYGFLGLFHCLQTSYNNVKPFACLLKEYYKEEQIRSIACFYTDGQMMVPYIAQMQNMMPAEMVSMLRQMNPGFAGNDKYLPIPYSCSSSNPVMEKVEHTEILEKYSAPNTAELFRLNAKNSPFLHTRTYAELKGSWGMTLSNPDDVTCNAFQYLLLFRNAKPANPLPE